MSLAYVYFEDDARRRGSDWRGTAKVEGDPSILKSLAATMVEFDLRFEIMPGTKTRQVAANESPYEATDVRQPVAE